MKIIIIFFLLTSCSTFPIKRFYKKNGNHQTSVKELVLTDHQKLANEQIAAHYNIFDSTKETESFNQLINDFSLFRKDLYKELLFRFKSKFTIEEFEEIKKALYDFTLDRKMSSRTGAPVFHNFHGHWKGKWIQDGTTKTYDHTWDLPYSEGAIINQKVTIAFWDDLNKKRQNEISAINTYNSTTGIILGAIDLKKDQAQTIAPQLGLYINKNTIIWITQDKQNDLQPYFSFSFEKVDESKSPFEYSIRGVGFNWNKKKKELKKMEWRTGVFQFVTSHH